MWRDDRYRDGDPPWVHCDQDTCQDPRCAELHVWYSQRGREGSKRRSAFRQKFGAYWVHGPGSEEKAARLALVMLEFTIREKNDAENSRRAA